MAKIGRNEPCSCGSGRKYKHCCLEAEQAAAAAEREAEREAEAASRAVLEYDPPLFGGDDVDFEDGPFTCPDLSAEGLPPIPVGSAKLARLVPPEIDIGDQEKDLDRIALQLKPYRKTFETFDHNEALAARAHDLFGEPRFAAMRFTADELAPYVKAIGCPPEIGSDCLVGYVADLAGVLFIEEDESNLAFYLLSQLPEMMAAGRYMDALLLHESAMLILEPPEEGCSPFLIQMVGYGLHEWFSARDAERAEVRDRFGIDLDAEWLIGNDAALDGHAVSADGGAPLTLRDYLATHRQLEHWLESRANEAQMAALAMLKREEPEILFLRDDEIAPWVSMLADRIINARELATVRKRRGYDGDDTLEPLLDAFAEVSGEMAEEILCGERLEELRRGIEALGCELEAAGRPDPLGIMGALIATSLPTKDREVEFLDLLCFLPLHRYVKRGRDPALRVDRLA